MWFVLLGIALVVLAVGGVYLRWRVLAALRVVGVSQRWVRRVGWGMLWLLFGYPLVVFVLVFGAIALGWESLPTGPGPIAAWILAYPFWMSLLIMLQAVPYLAVFDVGHLALRTRVGRARCDRYRAVGCLAVVAVFAVYTPTRIAIERDALDMHHYQVGEPAAGAPLRIVFVADLQLDRDTDEARADQVVALANAQRPDIVLAGGDWINAGTGFIETAAATAGKLRSRLGTFSVRGDHDHFAYRDRQRSIREVVAALARHNVQMIDNEVRWVTHRDKRIAVVYLSYNYIYRTPEDGIRALLDQTRGAEFSILVTHQFDAALAGLVRDRIDLVLAAHTHGGQVNPVLGFAHVSLASVETRYVEGRYQLGGTTVIVTAGVGFSIAPFRYASPASIEVIELYP